MDERRFQTQVWSLGVILYESGEAQFFWGDHLGMARLMIFSRSEAELFTCLRDSAVCQSMFCLPRFLSR